jgi:hypothetical protein
MTRDCPEGWSRPDIYVMCAAEIGADEGMPAAVYRERPLPSCLQRRRQDVQRWGRHQLTGTVSSLIHSDGRPHLQYHGRRGKTRREDNRKDLART